MADEKTTAKPTTIDYSGSQAEIDKAKAKAHDQDQKRLAKEHEDA
jgi:hypothetical protein